MQFTDKLTEIEADTTTFTLKNEADRIDFGSYTDRSYLDADPNKPGDSAKRAETNARQGGYFLRKGFWDAIKRADGGVISPEYIDWKGLPATPSPKEVMGLIRSGELSISGFTYNPNATEQLKRAAYEDIVKDFIKTSQNQDFVGDRVARHYQFCIFSGKNKVIYSNSNPKEHLSMTDIKMKLGMMPPEVLQQLQKAQMDRH
jgi:hypothetical protein